MKQETKELVEFIKDCVFRYQTELKRGEVDIGMIDGEEEDKTCNKAIAFLDSLPEIESHLCKGGYIQDKNGTPCCDGDKIKFEFCEEDFEEHWKDRYARIEYGELKFETDSKGFVILFGEDHNGYDWVDWNGVFSGPKWFEKVR